MKGLKKERREQEFNLSASKKRKYNIFSSPS